MANRRGKRGRSLSPLRKKQKVSKRSDKGPTKIGKKSALTKKSKNKIRCDLNYLEMFQTKTSFAKGQKIDLKIANMMKMSHRTLGHKK